MSSGPFPAASGSVSDPADGVLDEGRRYWKAAIAHLAPEKREAAWEFYLDRLESSAAADTLGGVMLLLEAHLAFFDELPARLGRAAQQIEAAYGVLGQRPGESAGPLPILGPASTSVQRRRWRTFLLASACAATGGTVVYVALSIFQHRILPVPANAAIQAGHLPPNRSGAIQVEPWNDPATHRPQGVVVSFARVAWTERTVSGGANVYVLSPVGEVRRDLEALRQTSK